MQKEAIPLSRHSLARACNPVISRRYFLSKKKRLRIVRAISKGVLPFFILASVFAKYYDDFLRNFPTAKAAAAIANIAAAAFGSGTTAFITPTPLKSKPGDPCVG